MRVQDALKDIERIYVEAAPLIYYIEENTAHLDKMVAVIQAIESGSLEAISSVITLTEVLIHPIRENDEYLEQQYRDILTNNDQFKLMSVSPTIAESAARLRVSYNLRTPDALHVATALDADCDAFLSNDLGLKRVTELKVILLDGLER
ncbi:MAG: PIN domain-containing protein [Chloroflexi bacterium]|nr:PIN domain-containing protein [Chloroflexota bacterium]